MALRPGVPRRLALITFVLAGFATCGGASCLGIGLFGTQPKGYAADAVQSVTASGALDRAKVPVESFVSVALTPDRKAVLDTYFNGSHSGLLIPVRGEHRLAVLCVEQNTTPFCTAARAAIPRKGTPRNEALAAFERTWTLKARICDDHRGFGALHCAGIPSLKLAEAESLGVNSADLRVIDMQDPPEEAKTLSSDEQHTDATVQIALGVACLIAAAGLVVLGTRLRRMPAQAA